ncbi:zinc finger CCCH domain protein [Rhynchospora pubera]|uniref:Zinc finger CCCH domain protein n=1 Tax=Rhynchospora pubera TaxID=906938 RepID=A0AAV8FQC5_9POAL|nr:zinc finger CCCH domain protein [Rhynchospora pubera]
MGEENRDDKTDSCGEVGPTSSPKPEPLTAAQFLSWKQRKDEEEAAKKAEAARKRAEDIASGAVQMNGRELFLHEPWVFDNELY